MFKILKIFFSILVFTSADSGVIVRKNLKLTKYIPDSIFTTEQIKENEYQYSVLYALKDAPIFYSPTLTSNVIRTIPMGDPIYVYNELRNSNGSYYVTEEGYINHSDLTYLKEYVFYPINKTFYTTSDAFSANSPLENASVIKTFELNEKIEVDGYNDFGYYRLAAPQTGFIKEKYLMSFPIIYGSNLTTITPASGIYYYNGRKETYYSSRVLYHYKTPQWYVDSEGFYHDPNGYYVVAASDMGQGTVFNCSKGSCIVLDCGCAPGVTDYYVNW